MLIILILKNFTKLLKITHFSFSFLFTSYFSSNFTIFYKKIIDIILCYAPLPTNFKKMYDGSPVKHLFIVTLGSLKTMFSLRFHIIFDLPTIQDHKKLKIFKFSRKLSITKILKRCLLVSQKVLHKSLINIASLSLTLHVVNTQFNPPPHKLKNSPMAPAPPK